MTTTRMIGLIALIALAATGCDIEFPNEEMNLAGADKTRPYAVVLDPLEARPGDQVVATLHFYEPDPSALAVDWQLALDYGLGLYEADEYERDIVAPDEVEPPVYDEQGFGKQIVHYTVPSDILLTTSRQPEVIEDELILAALAGTLGPVVTRADLDSVLSVREDWPNDLEYQQRMSYVADLFSCEIRLRAKMHGSTTVDVIRNQTVRWSNSRYTPNVNTNPFLHDMVLWTIPRPEVKWEDVDPTDPDVVVVGLDLNGDGSPIPVLVEANTDWTYYVSVRATLDDYTSPFDPTLSIRESYDLNWYYNDLDQPGSSHALFVTEDGDPAEMDDLERWARIVPPSESATRTFRINCVSFDYRWEWDLYSSTPGSDVRAGEITFVPPAPGAIGGGVSDP